MEENPLDILNNIKSNIKNIDNTLSERLKKEMQEKLKKEASDDEFYNKAVNNLGDEIFNFLIDTSKTEISETINQICSEIEETQDLVYELRKSVNKRDSGRSFFEKLQKEIARSSKEELKGKIMPIFSKLSNKLKQIEGLSSNINKLIVPKECTMEDMKQIMNEQLSLLISDENIQSIKCEVEQFIQDEISKFFIDLNSEISDMLNDLDKLITAAYNSVQSEIIKVSSEKILNCISQIKNNIDLFEKIQEKISSNSLNNYREVKGIRNSENISLLINYELSSFKEEYIKAFEEKTNTSVFGIESINEVVPDIIIYVSNIEKSDQRDNDSLIKIHKSIVNSDSKTNNAMFVWVFYGNSDFNFDECIDSAICKLKEKSNLSEKRLEYYINSNAVRVETKVISTNKLIEVFYNVMSLYYTEKFEKYMSLTKEIFEERKELSWQLLKSETIQNKKVIINPISLIQKTFKEMVKDNETDYEQTKLRIEKSLGIRKLNKLIHGADSGKVPAELKEVLLLWAEDVEISIEEILKASSKGSKVFFKPDKYKRDEVYFVKGFKEELPENQNWKVSLYLIQAMILMNMYYNDNLGLYYLLDVQREIIERLRADIINLKSMTELI